MTDNTNVAASWLQALAARGVTVTLRNGRLWLQPASAYKALTDDELLTLRHHRDAIKALVAAAGPAQTQPASVPAAGLDTAASAIVAPWVNLAAPSRPARACGRACHARRPCWEGNFHKADLSGRAASVPAAGGAAVGSVADKADARLKQRDFATRCLVHPDHPDAIAYDNHRWLRGE